MMKSLRTIAILTAAVVLTGLIGLTQVSCNKNVGEDPGEEDHSGHDHGAEGAELSPEDVASIHEEVIAALDLPDAQQQQLREIFAAYRADVAAWMADHEAEATELRAVLKKFHGPQEDSTGADIQMAMVRLGQLQAERNAKDAALLERLGEVLTPEQLVTAESVLYPVPPAWAKTTVNRFHLLTEMGLTEEQLAEVKAIMDEATEAMESADPTTSGEIMQVAWKRIIDDVLTPENHEQMRDMIRKVEHQRMVVASFAQLRLTGEQSDRIGEIWNRAYAEAIANPDRKYDIYFAAQQDIRENVLTSSQVEQLDQSDTGDPHGFGGGSPMGG